MRNIKFIHDSVKGKKHRRNEDRTFIIEDTDYKLYFLFDGVGSAVNSQLAIDIAVNFTKINYTSFYTQGSYRLKDLMHSINKEICDRNIPSAFTTYCSLYVPIDEKYSIKFSNLGDTRVYGVSKQYIFQHTNDDSLSKNVITKCLGMPSLSAEDFQEEEIKNSEFRLLLCSDGFYSFLETDREEFYHILNFSYLSNLKKRLKKEIKNNNPDDSSYIIIEQHV